jgi:hypothetical protein
MRFELQLDDVENQERESLLAKAETKYSITYTVLVCKY